MSLCKAVVMPDLFQNLWYSIQLGKRYVLLHLLQAVLCCLEQHSRLGLQLSAS